MWCKSKKDDECMYKSGEKGYWSEVNQTKQISMHSHYIYKASTCNCADVKNNDQ